MEQDAGRSAIVVAGGDEEGQFLPGSLPLDAVVIAADGGAHLAARLGRRVDLLVGDLDSIADEDLAALVEDGVRIQRHPADKDETDLELALDAAVVAGADRVDIVGGAGGRRSHDVGNLGLICSGRFAHVAIRWWSGRALVVPVHDRVEIEIVPGALVSLVPVGGSVTGVRTDGLRWPLHGDELAAGSTRGVSNVAVSSPIAVSVDSPQSASLALIIDEAQEVRS